MKIKIYNEFCIGCGLCEELVPEIFTMKGDKVELKTADIPENLIDRVCFAIEDCPGKAIQVKKSLSTDIKGHPGYAGSLQ